MVRGHVTETLPTSEDAEMARSAGFESCDATTDLPDGVKAKDLPDPTVHPTFGGYRDRKDLLATGMRVVCRKPSV